MSETIRLNSLKLCGFYCCFRVFCDVNVRCVLDYVTSWLFLRSINFILGFNCNTY